MADAEQNDQSFKTSDERFRYIGFGVYPGKIGDIFASDQERKTLVQKVRDHFAQSRGEVREGCTLLEERVTPFERSFMTGVAAILILSIFLPWFSGYFETVTVREVPVNVVAAPGAAATDKGKVEMTKVTEVKRDNRSLTGIGALLSIGSYGGMVFSSGFFLMLSGLLMIVYFLSCIALGVYNLYLLYGVKIKDPEAYALYLKKQLRYNWIPVIIWLVMFLFAVFGASYGFKPTGMITQVGDVYGLGAFIGLCSFGVYVSLGAFLTLAVKGKEI